MTENKQCKLVIVKVLHTLIWAFYVFSILYIVWAGLMDQIGLFVWIAIFLVVLEGLILLTNGWRCPLTILGERYTDQTNVGFDIYLPVWLAKHNKLIFTVLFSIGVILVIYRLVV